MVCSLVTEVKCCQTIIGLLILMSLRCHLFMMNTWKLNCSKNASDMCKLLRMPQVQGKYSQMFQLIKKWLKMLNLVYCVWFDAEMLYFILIIGKTWYSNSCGPMIVLKSDFIFLFWLVLTEHSQPVVTPAHPCDLSWQPWFTESHSCATVQCRSPSTSQTDNAFQPAVVQKYCRASQRVSLLFNCVWEGTFQQLILSSSFMES